VSRRLFVPALLATLAAILIAVLCPLVPARAGDGGVADAFRQALRSAFGGTISATAATDGQVLTWTAATRTWGPGTVSGGGETLAQTLALGADGNAVNQTNLGSLALASGKGITGGLHVVKVRRVANQALTTATLTDISWDTEDVDTGGYSAVGGGANVKAFTASEDMTVTITTQVNFTVDGTGIRRFFLTRYNSSDVGQDGTQWGQDASTASAGGYNLNHVGTVTFTFVMGAGDYIKVRAEQTRGSDLNVTASLHAVRAR
jgi:hypothetical protein